MKQSDMIDRISDRAGLSEAQARRALQAVIEALQAVGAEGDRLSLRGLGTFRGKERQPRKARNPATGSYILVPHKKILVFTMSNSLEL